MAVYDKKLKYSIYDFFTQITPEEYAELRKDFDELKDVVYGLRPKS